MSHEDPSNSETPASDETRGREHRTADQGSAPHPEGHSGSTSDEDPSRAPADPGRRRFLKGAVAAPLAAGLSTEQGPREDLYMPEEVWRDRITPPDDGKRYGWIVDTRKCFGCHACEVACKAENDVPLGSYIRQTIYHDAPRKSGAMARIMVPMACQHCEDAPCIKACPCGAMHMGAGGSVQVNYDKCSGHASCKEACPYGAIYIDPVANQAVKCHNCTHRVDEGMDPACVSTCPSDALVFGDLNDPDSQISQLTEELDALGALETLRAERETKPRMRYATDENHRVAAWESKVPAEGQSYHPDAYSVYEWSEDTPPHERTPHPADKPKPLFPELGNSSEDREER